MAQDVKLTVHADGTHAIDQLARAQRAMRAAVLRDQLTERLSLPALIQRGRGVAHDPACAPRAAAPLRWSEQARKALEAKRVTGFEPPYQFEQPTPEGGITVTQLQQYEAQLRASAADQGWRAE